jgi:hypothetical protein
MSANNSGRNEEVGFFDYKEPAVIDIGLAASYMIDKVNREGIGGYFFSLFSLDEVSYDHAVISFVGDYDPVSMLDLLTETFVRADRSISVVAVDTETNQIIIER